MPAILRLPPKLDLAHLLDGPDPAGWFWETPEDVVRVTGAKSIEHVQPAMLAAAAAWSAWHREEHGRSVEIDDSLKSPYAYQVGLLSALTGGSGSTAPWAVPVLRVRDKDEQRAALLRLGSILHLSHNRPAFDAVTYCVSELANNVAEHAATRLGAFIAGAYFPQSGRVALAVVDVGQGIPEHVRAYAMPQADDEQALRAAVEYAFTGARPPDMYGTPNNAGKGLAMVREVSRRTNGKFAVLSLTAKGVAYRGGVQVTRAGAPWRGTAVVLSFHPGELEDFGALTEAIGQSYAPRSLSPTDVRFSHAAPPGSAISVTVRPDVNQFAQDKDRAIKLRDELILPALEAGREVGLDFVGVRFTTQSLMHALLYLAFRRFGEDAVRRLTIHRASRQVRSVAKLVADYAIADALAEECGEPVSEKEPLANHED